MRDKMISTMVKLAVCPGECNSSDVCAMCTYFGKSNCEEQLRTDAVELLKQSAENQRYAEGNEHPGKASLGHVFCHKNSLLLV